LVCLWPVLFGGSPRGWAAAVALAFALVGMLRPAWLAPLNRLWMRFGLLLGAVVSPIALGLLFYGVLTPIGVLMRLFRSDPLRLRRDPSARSYWLPRQPPGPPPRSMDRQF
jgi:Saxitoxin biosynthesis operon protein SxtJ